VDEKKTEIESQDMKYLCIVGIPKSFVGALPSWHVCYLWFICQ